MKHLQRIFSALTAATAAVSTLSCMASVSAAAGQSGDTAPVVTEHEATPPMFIPWYTAGNTAPEDGLFPLDDGGMYNGLAYSSGSDACLIYPQQDCFAMMLKNTAANQYDRIYEMLKDYSDKSSFNISQSLIIFNHAAAFTGEEIDAVRDRFCKAGLIQGFYYPGEIGVIGLLNYDRTSPLTYGLDSEFDAEAVQKKLDETHPGCTVRTLDPDPDSGFPDGHVPGYRIETETELPFREQFRIAVELWQAFDIKPYEEYFHIYDPLKAVRKNSLLQYGDLNIDGETDVTDAVMLSRFISGDSTLQICDTGLQNAMQYSKDDTLDSDDLTLLLQVICKIVSICE